MGGSRAFSSYNGGQSTTLRMEKWRSKYNTSYGKTSFVDSGFHELSSLTMDDNLTATSSGIFARSWGYGITIPPLETHKKMARLKLQMELCLS